MKKRIENLILMLLATMLLFENARFGVVAVDNDEDDNKYYYSDVYNTGKDNGYSGYHEIDDDDLHYGWELGKFEISGFVGKKVDANGNMIFFKNYDTKIALDFILEQDIDELNNDDSMYICNDKNGYDEEFNVAKGDVEHGCLIVSKTDYQNITKRPILYGDYLVGVTQGQNTRVTLLEEGDYTVVLDYEIRHDRLHIPLVNVDTAPEYSNYKIKFSFSVRNSNCMVFVRDAVTQSELPEKAITENGFYLDLANSHYLNIYVKRSTIASNGHGLTEDTRFNGIISEGTAITTEGLYEITVKNTASEIETYKTVYVGDDPVLKAYVVTGYSLDDIYRFIEEGAEIDEEGKIIMPLPTATPSPSPEPTPTLTPSPVPTVSPTPSPEPVESIVEGTDQTSVDLSATEINADSTSQDRDFDYRTIVLIVGAGLLLIVTLVLIFKRRIGSRYENTQDSDVECAEGDENSPMKSNNDNETTESDDSLETEDEKDSSSDNEEEKEE